MGYIDIISVGILIAIVAGVLLKIRQQTAAKKKK